MRKVMKTSILAAVLALFCGVMFSGCELFAFFKFGKELADYNNVYVKNNTSATITLDIDEDDELTNGNVQDKTITIKKGATRKDALVGGWFKISTGDKDVLPSEDNDSIYTEPTTSDYYLIPAHTLVTINENNGDYTYTVKPRN